MRILAIDPGPTESAWLILEGDRVLSWSLQANRVVLSFLRGISAIGVPDGASPDGGSLPDVVAIEKVENFGMIVGAEVFETVFWSGRFAEAVVPHPVHRIPRRVVKVAVCGDTRAKDANVRAALIDRWGGVGAIGKKANPGPLYGISGDGWSALAVAVTVQDLAAEGRLGDAEI